MSRDFDDGEAAAGLPSLVHHDEEGEILAHAVFGPRGDESEGLGESEIVASIQVTGLTPSRLVATDGSSVLVSVGNLASWIAGTSNQLTVTDDGDGTITLSLPQNIHTAATPQFAGLTLTGSLAFSPDNSVDLTAVGSRPRDVYAGRQFLGASGSAAIPSKSYSADTDSGEYLAADGQIAWTIASTPTALMNGGTFRLRSTASFSWSSTDDATVGADLTIFRDAAAHLGIRNSTTAQKVSVYKTFTAASNYRRIDIDADNGRIITNWAGTGTSFDLGLGVGAIIWKIEGSTGHFLANVDNTYDIGASGATRPRTGYFGTSVVTPVVSNAGAIIIQTTTATDISFKINSVTTWVINNASPYNFYPNVDATYTLGHASFRILEGHFSGAVIIGTNPASVGVIRIPNGQIIRSRNNDNDADLAMMACQTVNTVKDVLVLNEGGVGVVLRARSGGAAPTTSDLAAGEWCLWRDTGGATTKLYYNNAGAIESVALA